MSTGQFTGPAPRSNTVLLTQLPTFLHSSRAVRDWVVSCGNARNVQLIPSESTSSAGSGSGGYGTASTRATTADTKNKSNVDKDDIADKKDDNWNEATNAAITALVTMSHSDSALKVIAAFRYFQTLLKEHLNSCSDLADEQYGSFQVYLVPTNPDIPLPPPILDTKTTEILGQRLFDSFQQWKTGLKTIHTLESEETSRNSTRRNDNTSDDNGGILDDTTTSGPRAELDDEEADDLLKSSQVLEAVRQFRQKLEIQQGSKATRRKELVQSKINQMLPIVRERMLQQQQEAAAAAALSGTLGSSSGPPVPPPPPPPGHVNMPPPPLPTHLPVPMGLPQPPPPLPSHLNVPNFPPPPLPVMGLPPPPLPSVPPPPPIHLLAPPPQQQQPRGVSNLPAWMTQQQQQLQPPPPPPPPVDVEGEMIGEPATKKLRLSTATTTAEYDPMKPFGLSSIVDPIQRDMIRTYVSEQLQQYLGDPDRSLMDFILEQYIYIGSKTPNDLIPELQEVLEDDTIPFVQSLWEKIQEMNT